MVQCRYIRQHVFFPKRRCLPPQAGLYVSILSVLAASIVVAALNMVDVDEFRRAWAYDRADALAWVGSEHFRNVERHGVETLPGVLFLRIDESIFFGNLRAIEALTDLQRDLSARSVALHLAGRIHLSAHAAYQTLGLLSLVSIEYVKNE
jgi:MFS superfamily sulfate permease-like transporter